MLRFLTAGESHGPALTAILEGMIAGVPVSAKDITSELARRRHGYGRGTRMKLEQDELEILGGIRHGRTLGSPIAMVIRNTEWPKWDRVMAVGEEDAELEDPLLTKPRPGHADLAGMQKYGFGDARPILERASARETAARTAVGTVCKALLAQLEITVLSHVLEIGDVRAQEGTMPGPEDIERIDASPVRCVDPDAEQRMTALIDETRRQGDTLGGVVEVLAYGVPPGLGSHVHWDRKLDAQLAAALMSIQAIKGVEIGPAFDVARAPGSQAHDHIGYAGDGFARETDRSGGTEGGVSTGQVLRARAAMKPLSSLARSLPTVDVHTKEPAPAITQRSDVCAVPAAGVVAEHMVAFVLAEACLQKFGGDSLVETKRNMSAYREALRAL
ncbi:MAG TPA: chorismate synthase [Actinomycetota bacterium]